MKPLGVISGTVILRNSPHFSGLEELWVETRFGRAQVLRSPLVIFIPRHGTDPRSHILPHRINHAANLQALKDLGAEEVIGVHSTGSLKPHLKPGTLVIPDDYLLLTAGPTTVLDKATHLAPALSDEVRRNGLAAARDCKIGVIDGGIYWQTSGPRFETRAEIAMMSSFADLVGMTMAGEAIIAQELGLPFASLCSVDNFANGLGGGTLTQLEVSARAQENAKAIQHILARYLERRTRTAGTT